MKNTAKKTAQQRFDEIRQMIQDNRNVSVPQLAEKFNVSVMTIHRDLDKLQQAGQVKKTWGGAMPAEKMVFEFDFTQRRQKQKKEKQVIAKKAMEFISPGQKIILDTGTTTLELACLLKSAENLTVITPSLAVASVLQFSKGIETILLGGVIREKSPDLTGVVTEKVLEMFMVDIAFQGADSINLNGEMYNSDMRIARVDQKMRKRAKKTYILCDSSKIGKIDFASNGSISEVDALITDSNISSQQLAVLKKTGTEIIINQI